MGTKIDEVGNKYGKLTVLRGCGSTPKGKARWVCLCDCGAVTSASGTALRFGSKKSCSTSCGLIKSATVHAFYKTRLYGIWDGMKQRCMNTRNTHYHNYGGRGITVCEDWMESEPFLKWALDNGYRDDLFIDRRDNDLGYFPENCRFVTRIINNTNIRKSKANKTGYTGVSMSPSRSFRVRVTYNKVKHNLGTYQTKEEAVRARNQFIMDNRLPHKIQEIKCDSCS